MAKKPQPKQQQDQTPPRKPTHCPCRVIVDGKQAIWTPIGAAWPNKDGLGFNLSCDAVPLQGRLVLREVVERDEGGQQ